MNNNVEVEGRPRPLSTGLWTLFSWLRRDDRSVSSESLSSAGSDRTVASFAFLTPARYHPAKGPLIVPPPGPPTDSYKKRVHDRNLRRHHDRDITLHRKYGLYKSEGTSGYDAFSLPPARRVSGDPCNRWDRERRATSECYQRRLAHVPGKRRAPLPPVAASPVGTSSLSRRYTRKRPAPQPPVKILDINKDVSKDVEVDGCAGQMSSHAYQDKPKIKNNDATMGCKSEKYSKKDASSKDHKLKPEKSFLKQMFDSKKRNSYIDTSAVKVLPSISELDKQAAELIETCKLKTPEQNNNVTFNKLGSQSSNQTDTWFCLRCLRKYNSTEVTCAYCVSKGILNSSEIIKNKKEPTAKSSSNYTQTEKDLPNVNNVAEDKQKLKEMLKEMKDSLPKRPKHELSNTKQKTVVTKPLCYSTETPTLRVGSIINDDKKHSQASTSNNNLKSVPELACSTKSTHQVSPQAVLVAQVVSAYQKNVNNHLNLGVKLTTENGAVAQTKTDNILQKQTQDMKKLHTPLKISSLLNPVYVPKNNDLTKPQLANIVQKESSVPTSSAILPGPSTSQTSASKLDNDKTANKTTNLENCTKTGATSQTDKSHIVPTGAKKVIETNIPRQIINESPSVVKEGPFTNVLEAQNQHSRRRDLINQLEKSIAQGDERAAAEAAAKLAQLRLSCSVLSFSSQILSQASSSSTNNEEKKIVKETNSALPTVISDTKPVVHNELPEPKLVKPRSPPRASVSSEGKTSGVLVPSVAASAPKTEISKQSEMQKKKDDLTQKDIKAETNKNDNVITIAVLVEDREATRGPVHLRINRNACIRDLRREAETSLGLAANLQRWIIGRVLCVNDNTPIASLAGPDFTAPFYLCVVESETKHETNPQKNNETPRAGASDNQVKTRDVYTELVQLEQQALVPNAENFECGVCMEEYPPGQGVVLRECVHIFCKDCLSDVVRHCEEPDVPCPAMGCRGMLQEREIKALVSAEDYERWLARGLAAAESGTRNAFHCRTRDCKGWALCDPGVQRFPCPVCKCINCVPCQAIHDGDTCQQHRSKLKQAASKTSRAIEADDGTRTLLNSLISKGEALECPECSAIITKKWGCDWVKCSACKTEICWVTRGRRWGPGGKGDTSAGCRCGVDGKRCHPSCGYCH